MVPGGPDRGFVEVDPVHEHFRMGARHGDARSALAAGEVGDPRGRVCLEPRVDLWHGRQPLLPEEALEERPGELGLALVEVEAVVGVRDAASGAERL